LVEDAPCKGAKNWVLRPGLDTTALGMPLDPDTPPGLVLERLGQAIGCGRGAAEPGTEKRDALVVSGRHLDRSTPDPWAKDRVRIDFDKVPAEVHASVRLDDTAMCHGGGLQVGIERPAGSNVENLRTSADSEDRQVKIKRTSAELEVQPVLRGVDVVDRIARFTAVERWMKVTTAGQEKPATGVEWCTRVCHDNGLEAKRTHDLQDVAKQQVSTGDSWVR
jgi:hypothetical protein